MKGKEAYRRFWEQESPDGYLNPMYLDVCCSEGEWNAAYLGNQEKIDAVWLYYQKKKLGMKYITMPPGVKYLGPFFAAHVSNSEKQSFFDKLSLMVPPVSSYEQNFSCNMVQAATEKWIDIQYKAMDTYYLDVNLDIETLKSALHGNYRRAIKKFLGEYDCDFRQKANESQVQDFTELLIKSAGPLKEYGITESLIQKLVVTAEENNFGKLLLNYKDEKPVGGAFVIWDEKKAYYVYAGNNPEFKKQYPGVLTAWQTILYLKENTSVNLLDFYGSSIESIARVWQKMGAKKHQYPFVAKKPDFWFDMLQKTKNKFLK